MTSHFSLTMKKILTTKAHRSLRGVPTNSRRKMSQSRQETKAKEGRASIEILNPVKKWKMRKCFLMKSRRKKKRSKLNLRSLTLRKRRRKN